MDIEYLDGYIATIAEHKKNICEAIKSYASGNYAEMEECAYVLEETARFLGELEEEWQDDTEAYVFYGEQLNHFEIRIATNQERYSRWTERHNFSAREYFNLLRALTDKQGMSSGELSDALTEEDYGKVMQALESE